MSSNPIVSVQVRAPAAPPRGAVLGSLAAAVWTAASTLVRAVRAAVRPAPGTESRHA